MDQIDHNIVEILQRDGRITMKALAAQIHMSIPAATERVRRLEDQHIIRGYRAVIDPAALGQSVQATVLATARAGQQSALREFVRSCPLITDAWDIVGPVGELLRVACPDMTAFRALLAELRGFATTESYLDLQPIKRGGVPAQETVPG